MQTKYKLDTQLTGLGQKAVKTDKILKSAFTESRASKIFLFF